MKLKLLEMNHDDLWKYVEFINSENSISIHDFITIIKILKKNNELNYTMLSDILPTIWPKLDDKDEAKRILLVNGVDELRLAIMGYHPHTPKPGIFTEMYYFRKILSMCIDRHEYYMLLKFVERNEKLFQRIAEDDPAFFQEILDIEKEERSKSKESFGQYLKRNIRKAIDNDETIGESLGFRLSQSQECSVCGNCDNWDNEHAIQIIQQIDSIENSIGKYQICPCCGSTNITKTQKFKKAYDNFRKNNKTSGTCDICNKKPIDHVALGLILATPESNKYEFCPNCGNRNDLPISFKQAEKHNNYIKKHPDWRHKFFESW